MQKIPVTLTSVLQMPRCGKKNNTKESLNFASKQVTIQEEREGKRKGNMLKLLKQNGCR